MKKLIVTGIFIFGLFSITQNGYAQSLKDALKSAAVQNAVSAVTQGSDLTVKAIEGKWIYQTPSVKLESDDVLKSIAGTVASSELEKVIDEYCRKIGIEKGDFRVNFKSDSTFTNDLKGKILKGTYSINKAEKSITLNYGATEHFKLTTLKADAIVTKDQLTLLFDADKILEFLSKVSDLSANSTIKAVNQLAQQYNGMKIGLNMKK